jgi:hypothetical protein
MSRTKRLTIAAVTATVALGSAAVPAAAHHEHTLNLPNGHEQVMPCEPAALATTVHPIHYGFHLALDATRRGDDRGPGWLANHASHPGGVSVTVTGDCPMTGD